MRHSSITTCLLPTEYTPPYRARFAPDGSLWRIRLPEPVEGFEKARQAQVVCGRAARSAILVYAQALEGRRRPEIAEAFFEPNSTQSFLKHRQVARHHQVQTNKSVLHPSSLVPRGRY